MEKTKFPAKQEEQVAYDDKEFEKIMNGLMYCKERFQKTKQLWIEMKTDNLWSIGLEDLSILLQLSKDELCDALKYTDILSLTELSARMRIQLNKTEILMERDLSANKLGALRTEIMNLETSSLR